MITDEQWRIFGKHIEPNTTILYEGRLGILLEKYPHTIELFRIECELGYCSTRNISARNFRVDGSLFAYDEIEDLHFQLNDSLISSMVCPRDLLYWCNGGFLTFEQILALGNAP